jgi:hypothetical protein
MDPNTFPAFPSQPTRERFPMYGYVPYGSRGWTLECDVRVKIGPTDSRSEMVNPIPGVIRTRKEAEQTCYNLNLRVWQAVQEA